MDTNYKYSYNGNDTGLLYFSQNPALIWSFQHFTEWINADKVRKIKQNTILKKYLNALETILRDKNLPTNVKYYVNNLIEQKVKNKDSQEQRPVNYIIGNKTVSIGDNNFIENIYNEDREVREASEASEATEEYSEEQELSEEEESSDVDQDSSEVDEFSSDLTINHHPQRTADYFLIQDNTSEEIDQQNDENNYVIGNFSISDKCKKVKESTFVLKKNPASLSDIRLLSANDIYIFDDNINYSITKYFGVELHKLIMSDLNFNMYRPNRPNKSHNWCLEVAENPPDDLMSSLKLCTDFLIEATKQDNEVDLHMAHALIQLLPVFIAGTHDSSVEDSYVHHYLAPILQSIYSTDKRFTVRWANGALNDDSTFKPDFQVFSRIINIKCIIIVAEFKPTSRNSAIESDFLKLGKQMKLMYNELVQKRVPKPIVCGLLCQGESLNTYAMDMPSPQVYRMVKLSNATLCRNVDELHLLPTFIYKLIQVKNITAENIKKAEDCIILANDAMNRHPCNPPESWLTFSSCQLSRSSKKRKQNN